MRSFLLFLAMLGITTPLLAHHPLPAKVDSVFRQMYPNAAYVGWSQMANCYVAETVVDGVEVDVWFNNDAQWVMTETAVESLEKIPKAVAQSFMNNPLSGVRLRDVRIITFPKHPTVVVIEAEGYNSNEEFQLFYYTDGKLYKELNVSEWGGEIYPALFE